MQVEKCLHTFFCSITLRFTLVLLSANPFYFCPKLGKAPLMRAHSARKIPYLRVYHIITGPDFYCLSH